ncbi:putative lipid II flippase MurJ [Clostridium gelidum]|uniref:Probable lipid II flippase MurJ n=1 Tax=Clostridium gelidum TaxID=704125 RepID=A0ABN6J5H8_9CLOT|nr:murein biosynthesis integral membrane protein MurJ [Clostridium gelidum]BCZ49018.1 putative lipid II flippase MurJ [Clostridium gelidum]
MTKKNIIKSAGIIIFINILSKILGLLRDSTIASSFGASIATDAYAMSLTIPNILYGIIGAAVSTTFIPILSESYKNNGKEDMYKFANSIINIILIISIFLSVFGWIFTPSIVKFIAPNFGGEKYSLTVNLTRISVLNLLFMSMTCGFVALLQTMNDFIAPTLIGIVYSIPIIMYNFIGSKLGIYGLNIVTLLGFGLQILIQIPWLIKNGYKYRFKIDFHDARIIKMFRLILPILIGTGVNQINILIDRIMASGLPDGSIASFDFALKINEIVYTIFAMAIVTVIYPKLSMESSGNDLVKFKGSISKAINNINIVMIPSAIGLMILRVTVVSVLFKHGAFNINAVTMTSNAVLFLAIGMIFYGIRDICNRAFYALQDTKTPMINGIIAVGACITMNIIMVPILGLGGLALANTTSAIVSASLLIINLRRKIGSINGTNIIISSLKMFLASIIMGIVVYNVNRFIPSYIEGFKGEIITLIISIIIGIIIYFIMLFILKVEEFKIILDILKKYIMIKLQKL